LHVISFSAVSWAMVIYLSEGSGFKGLNKRGKLMQSFSIINNAKTAM